MLQPFQTRLLKSNEIAYFNLSENENVTISSKLNKNYSIYHSEMNKKLEKTCSFIIKCKNVNTSKNGIASIKYFLKFHGRIFACVQTFIIKENEFIFNINGNNYSNQVKILRQNGIFDNFFNIGCLSTDEEFFKPAENIICKCIKIPISGFKNYFYFSDFGLLQEHD